MQELKQRIETYIGKNPWTVCGVCIAAGFVLALMVPATPQPRSGVPGFKEGFLIVLSTAKLLDPSGDLGLRGSRVQLVRHGDERLPCRIVHPPLAFSANERNVTLAGSLEEIEATVLALVPEDLKLIDVIRPQDGDVDPCADKVKIVYGHEE